MPILQTINTSLPIVQAPMAGVQNSELTVAVSNAGGLGSLPCAMLNKEQLANELALITSQTKAPYNLNFFCHKKPLASLAQEDRWKQQLSPYYQEFGVDSNQVIDAPTRLPFDQQSLDVIAPFKPPVVSFHFGLPEAKLLQQIKAWGAIILSSATTVAEAKWLAANGADMIIAQGSEAGGHRGMFLTQDISTQLGTFALVPQIVAEVDIPVIAAGGIACSKGVAAVLQLGAVAAQVGTAYLLCPEATTSAMHREAIASADAQHTALTNVLTGRPARGIVNRLIQEQGPMSDLVPQFPLAASALVALRGKAEAQSLRDFSNHWCGQNTQGCSTLPAAQITHDLATLIGN
jgi:nitronate monooxygenase